MKNRLLSLITGLALALSLASVTHAASYTVGGMTTSGTTSFGMLDPATFGGTGIPQDNVQITTYGNLVLGLTAHQRYTSPALTNDGVGTFEATPGIDTSAPGTYAKWNFGFYVSGVPQGFTTKLVYDLDPSYGNELGTNSIPFGNFNLQDSWNLEMGFLSGGGLLFDPMAAGEYQFAVVAMNGAGQEVAYSSILVQVGERPTSSVPDSGTTSGLLAVGFLALGCVAHSRNKSTRNIQALAA